MCAWNATFERLIWKHVAVRLYGFPLVDDDTWIDTMLQAAAANVPRGLDGAAKAVGAPFQKDPDGHRLMLKLTSAKRTPDPDRIKPEELHRLGEYCKDDVLAEDSTGSRLPPWPTMAPWHIMPAVDRRINDRGVMLDVALAEGLKRACEAEVKRLDFRMAEMTSGAVASCSKVEDLKRWLVAGGVQVPLKEQVEEDDSLEDDDEDYGKATAYRLRKNDVIDLLAQGGISESAEEALEMRLDAAKISTAKLGKMLGAVGSDHRLRGSFVLGGAQTTMRWSANAWQLHNFPRETIPLGKLDKAIAAQRLVEAVEDGSSGDPDRIRFFWDKVLAFASRMLRRTLMAPDGATLLSGDYKAIEACITAWLCGQEDIVQAFLDGKDVYRMDAAPIYKKTEEALNSEERQAGKVSRLSLGFGGGPKALIRMAFNYGIKLTLDDASYRVQTFRNKNTNTVSFWDENLQAAVNAVLVPGREFSAEPGHISWCLWQGALCCRLPSGRLLRYWAPRLVQGKWPDGSPKNFPDLTALAVKGRAVFRHTMWRGIACQNPVQAIAADLLAGALAALERENLPVVIHCHDQAAIEVPEHRASDLKPMFEQIMSERPSWAGSRLPISVEAKISPRFG